MEQMAVLRWIYAVQTARQHDHCRRSAFHRTRMRCAVDPSCSAGNDRDAVSGEPSGKFMCRLDPICRRFSRSDDSDCPFKAGQRPAIKQNCRRIRRRCQKRRIVTVLKGRAADIKPVELLFDLLKACLISVSQKGSQCLSRQNM